MRDKLIVIKDNEIDYIHFTNDELSGANSEAWYPLGGLTLFQRIESILKLAGIATNVTSVEFERECGNCEDYMVTFNKAS